MLSRRWLTIMLGVMCVIPIVTISVLWQILPPVYEHQLDASVRLEGTPVSEYYELQVRDRPAIKGGIVIVKNESDEAWTNMIIRVNRSFMAYEKDAPLEAGAERQFELSRFQTRTSNRLDLRYHQIKNIEVYARLPSGARATHETDF